MLREVSKRMATVGDVLCSFFATREGFKAKEMRKRIAPRRRIEMISAFECPSLLRIKKNCRMADAAPKTKRRRISHIGKMGAIVV
jgi:hypothetical protein